MGHKLTVFHNMFKGRRDRSPPLKPKMEVLSYVTLNRHLLFPTKSVNISVEDFTEAWIQARKKAVDLKVIEPEMDWENFRLLFMKWRNDTMLKHDYMKNGGNIYFNEEEKYIFKHFEDLLYND